MPIWLAGLGWADAEASPTSRTGATRVLIFGHRVRRGPTNWHALGPGNAERRGPVHGAHVDQSYDGAVTELRFYLPAEADELLKRRFQIINVCLIFSKNLTPP